MLNLVHGLMSTCGRKQEYSGESVFLFIVFRELHFIWLKAPDTEPIFSVVCSSDILEHHNIIKRLWHIFWIVWFVQTTKTCPSIEWRNPVVPSLPL